jgi:hypothetical protein
MNHTYTPISAGDELLDKGWKIGDCQECGLGQIAHEPLVDHPEEMKLRRQELQAATTLSTVARRASQALNDHRRVDALVLLTKLEVMTDNLRLAMRKAIDDQMKATRE